MTALRFTRVADERTAKAWLQVHNMVIPTDLLTLEQVHVRSRVNVLDLAELHGETVGCSTVRPATDGDPVTVIVRILPAYRRRGLGSAFLVHAMARARDVDAVAIQTIVLASNAEGLRFALRRGFVESERYTLDGDTVAYVHLAASLGDVVLGERDG